MGSRSMKDVGGAVLAGSSPPFLGRERAAVDVDVGPERRSPRHHETCLALARSTSARPSGEYQQPSVYRVPYLGSFYGAASTEGISQRFPLARQPCHGPRRTLKNRVASPS